MRCELASSRVHNFDDKDWAGKGETYGPIRVVSNRGTIYKKWNFPRKSSVEGLRLFGERLNPNVRWLTTTK